MQAKVDKQTNIIIIAASPVDPLLAAIEQAELLAELPVVAAVPEIEFAQIEFGGGLDLGGVSVIYG